ncbi:hypothetical protein [Lewinella sp. LCG006]|uniref:hypothetical protein n=1 Tax=Lewinella sp. LCG006 TaxID=3231911 RepID=UPI00346069B9
MKLLFSFFFLIVMFSCSQPKEEGTETSAEAIQSNVVEATSQIEEPKLIDACEQVSAATMAKVMGWTAAEVTAQTMMSFKDRKVSVCNYFIPTGETALVRLAWKSEKSQANGVLSRSMQQLLTEGEQGYTYQEVKGLGSQAVFGTFQQQGQYYYQLRSRFGEKIELNLEASSKQDDADGFQKKLLNLAQLMLE